MSENSLHIHVGQVVYWKWGYMHASGTVLSIHTQKTTIVSNGSVITRNGTPQNPAIIIQHKNGNQVLKLASELSLDAIS